MCGPFCFRMSPGRTFQDKLFPDNESKISFMTAFSSARLRPRWPPGPRGPLPRSARACTAGRWLRRALLSGSLANFLCEPALERSDRVSCMMPALVGGGVVAGLPATRPPQWALAMHWLAANPYAPDVAVRLPPATLRHSWHGFSQEPVQLALRDAEELSLRLPRRPGLSWGEISEGGPEDSTVGAGEEEPQATLAC